MVEVEGSDDGRHGRAGAVGAALRAGALTSGRPLMAIIAQGRGIGPCFWFATLAARTASAGLAGTRTAISIPWAAWLGT